MKKIAGVIFIMFFYSCNIIENVTNNRVQRLADNINVSIENFSATYYRFPNDPEELYKFILSHNSKGNIFASDNDVLKYLKSRRNKIYIHSTNNFMFFYGKKYDICIDRTFGLCDWLKTGNVEDDIHFTMAYFPSNFLNAEGDFILNIKKEFENDLKEIRSKYKDVSFRITNNDTIVKRGVFQYDKLNGLIPLCEFDDLTEYNPFIDELKSYLKEFTSKHSEVDKILFYTTIKTN